MKIRVLLFDPARAVDNPANIWVEASTDAGVTTLQLLHDYPDCKPQTGWTVQDGDKTLTVQQVEGQRLTCVEQDHPHTEPLHEGEHHAVHH